MIVAELVGAQSGLGYMIQINRLTLRIDNVLVGVLSIAVIGAIMNYTILALSAHLTAWRHE